MLGSEWVVSGWRESSCRNCIGLIIHLECGLVVCWLVVYVVGALTLGGGVLQLSTGLRLGGRRLAAFVGRHFALFCWMI